MLGRGEIPTVLTRNFSEATAQRIDAAVERTLKRAFEGALAILRANQRVLEDGARALLGAETLDEDALRDLKARLHAPTARGSAIATAA